MRELRKLPIFRSQFMIGLVAIPLIGISCEPHAKPLQRGDVITPIDTAAAMEDALQDERTMRLDLFPRYAGQALDTNTLRLDTFELCYMQYACSCPDWSDTTSWNDSLEGKREYYLDPADPSVAVKHMLAGNIVRFFGVLLPEWGLPKHEELYGHPPDGPVIVYYGYEMIRPWRFWGPEIRIYSAPGDTFTHRVNLLVK